MIPTLAKPMFFSDDTSLEIFRKFIFRDHDRLNASAVLSVDCYHAWLNARKTTPGRPDEAFRRVLTAHVRASDGRKPFQPEEEEAVLIELRKKMIWPCFLQTDSRVGINGFRAQGYHEKMNSLRNYGHSNLERSHFLSSYEIFVNFANKNQVLSKECYEMWVATRRNGVRNAEFSFRKALIAHLTGKDGRRPFPPGIERIVLHELRKKKTWPCFAHRSEAHIVNIGKNGFNKPGYHEARDECIEKPAKRFKEDNFIDILLAEVKQEGLIIPEPSSVPLTEELSEADCLEILSCDLSE